MAVWTNRAALRLLNKKVNEHWWMWRMAARTIKIELRYSSDKDTDKAMEQVARTCARTLMASAMLISSRKPTIALMTEANFEGEKELNLHDDDSDS